MVKTAQKQAERNRYKARRLELLIQGKAKLMSGKCPLCGCALRHNSSITGWWQCNALGAVGFQTGDGIGKTPCSFQFFYDPSPQELDELRKLEAYLVVFGSGETETGRQVCQSPDAVRGMLEHDSDMSSAEIDGLFASGIVSDEDTDPAATTQFDYAWVRLIRLVF